MSYPAGVSLAVLTTGSVTDFFGSDAAITATVTPVLKGTSHLVHEATGALMIPSPQVFTAGAGEGISFAVPHTDQDGWRDGAGNAFKGWYYKIALQVGANRSGGPAWTKTVQPIMGQALIDLDLVAGEQIGVPVSAPVAAVTSIAGLTGAVTEDQLQALGLGGASDPEIAALIQDNTTATGAALADSFAPRMGLPTTALVSGVYDPVRSIYNFKPAQVQRLRAALGRAYAKKGAANLAFVGDSTTSAGELDSSGPWPYQLVSLLVGKGYRSTGTGVVGAYRGSSADKRLTHTTAWRALTSAATLLLNETTADPLVFTSDVAGTIARVHYSQRSTSFAVAVDGGTPVAVTPTGTTNAPAVYEVTGLPNTTHAISVVRTGAGAVQVLGLEVASATTGVRIYQAGIGGAKVPTGPQLSWMTVDGYSTAPTGFNADCVFLMFETNDTGPTPVTDYKTNLQGIITNMRNNGSDVVLVTAIPSDGKTFGPYTAALYELADANDLPLVDLQHRMGTYARANALGLMKDALHANESGYAVVADSVATAVGIA